MIFTKNLGKKRPFPYSEILFTGFFKGKFQDVNLLPLISSDYEKVGCHIIEGRLHLYPETSMNEDKIKHWKNLHRDYLEFVPIDDKEPLEFGWFWVLVLYDLDDKFHKDNFSFKVRLRLHEYLAHDLRYKTGYASTSELRDKKLRTYVDSFSRWPTKAIQKELDEELFPDRTNFIKLSPKPDQFPWNNPSSYKNRALYKHI